MHVDGCSVHQANMVCGASQKFSVPVRVPAGTYLGLYCRRCKIPSSTKCHNAFSQRYNSLITCPFVLHYNNKDRNTTNSSTIWSLMY